MGLQREAGFRFHRGFHYVSRELIFEMIAK